jgi:hypothetical protein
MFSKGLYSPLTGLQSRASLFDHASLLGLGVSDPRGPMTQDLFTGTEDNDDFVGTDFNDEFDLTAGGRDDAQGRDGDDLFVFGNKFNEHDRAFGGSNSDGGDVLQLFGDYSDGVVFADDTVQGIELMQLLGSQAGGGSYNFTLADANVHAGDLMTIFLAGSEDFADMMVVDGSAETDGDLFLLSSASGDDVLVAGGGNDCLDGGFGGTDVLDGGAGGFNRVTFGQADMGVVVSLALQGAAQDVGGGRMVTLSNFHDLGGSAGDDALTGDDSANWLASAGGSDVMQGGAGDDFVQVDNFGEEASVTVHGGSGADLLSFFTSGTGVDFFLWSDDEQDVTDALSVAAERFENLGGSQFNDVLGGDHNANTLYGDAGNDWLYGDDGDDHLLGDSSLQPHLANGAGRNGFEVVEANGARDSLYGGDGNDLLEAGGYRDRLTGGEGVDTMLGGTGSDVFIFKKTSDSGVGEGNRDVMDFAHSNWERLDLSRIDADENTADNQAFFLGGSEFTNAAGELVQFVEGGHTVVAGDVNGDGVADFELEMMSDAVLVAEDFWL